MQELMLIDAIGPFLEVIVHASDRQEEEGSCLWKLATFYSPAIAPASSILLMPSNAWPT